jgi:tetratricopeptide (TPR) repeat protein
MFNHAVTPINRALQLNSKEASIKEFAGKIYFNLEDYKKAETYFTEFIEISSEVSAEIYTMLAKSFLKQRKKKEAKLFFELALNVDPDYRPAMNAKEELL